MKNIYFTVGPSQLYPTVTKHLKSAIREQVGSFSHRGGHFHELYSRIVSNLKTLLSIPQDYHVFFLSSGTEAMERIIENCVEKDSLHLVEGDFGDRFYKTAQELKRSPQKIELLLQDDLGLKKDLKNIELLGLTHNDTSTGVALPMEKIYAFKKQNPNVLIAIDVVSSIPYVDLNYSLLDCIFFSVQKGFGLPAGLGVVIVSPKALAKSYELQKRDVNIGTYHNFPTLHKYAQKFETPETPNVFEMYIFDKVLNDMLSIGINLIRRDTERKAKLLYDFFESSKDFIPTISDLNFRSQTTLVITCTKDSKWYIEKLKEEGILIGSGYGKNRENQIRIANFPAHSVGDVKTLLKLIS